MKFWGTIYSGFRKKEKTDTIKYHTIWESDNTQENITYKRAKRLAIS